MHLTNEELADAEKLLARMEKNARAWRWARFVLLGMGIILLSVVVWEFVFWQTVLNTAIPIEPGNAVTAADLLRERHTVTNICMHFAVAIFHAVLVACLLSIALGHWNKGKRDSLLVKLARSYVDGQRPSAEKPGVERP